MNKNHERPADVIAGKALKSISNKYLILGKGEVSSWKAWLVIGLVAGISLGVMLISNRSAQLERAKAAELGTSKTLTASATLSSANMSGNKVSYSLDFGSSFTAITKTKACFMFVFEQDLLDKNDSLRFNLKENAGNSYGFLNNKNTSLSSRNICITPKHGGFSELLVGKVSGQIWMTKGTLNVKSLTVTVTDVTANAGTSEPSTSTPVLLLLLTLISTKK